MQRKRRKAVTESVESPCVSEARCVCRVRDLLEEDPALLGEH